METYGEQMQRDMALRNLSPKTQLSHHRAARDLEDHFGRSPDRLNVDELKEAEQKTETWQETLLRLCGIDVGKCPACGERTMRTVEIIKPARCKGPPWI